ncbi:hypothetical protein KUTeg_017926 [Tegillarca granosa]|uniref:Uncharacterized protein n=1 Tax=Tegillarca granosa TaxID=220873 RepID=A0ABQ9EGC0_TEGGR|nr:hypothetical protein KUTeg_017926 [Tegillarca granosa]
MASSADSCSANISQLCNILHHIKVWVWTHCGLSVRPRNGVPGRSIGLGLKLASYISNLC